MVSLIPSLTYGDAFAVRKIRSLLVSFSVNSHGTARSARRYRSPRRLSEAMIVCGSSCRITGLGGGVADHDQVLRNQSVGSTWSVAAFGPRFQALILMRSSSGPDLAYSTTMSK